MKENKYANLPYDPEKEERAIFQMALAFIFLMLLAFLAGEILSDFGIHPARLIKIMQ